MAEYKVEVLMGGDLENINLQLYGVHELLKQWGATPKVDSVTSWGHDVELYDYNDDGDDEAELHTFSVLVEIPDDIDFTELEEQMRVMIFEGMPETFPNIMDIFILDVFVDGSAPNPMREGREKVKENDEELRRLTAKLNSDEPLTPEEIENIEKKIIPGLPFALQMLVKGALEIHKEAAEAERW